MRFIANIDVPELAPAIAFYRAALGFELERIIDGDVAELAAGATRLYLLQNPAGSRPVPALELRRDYARHWTPVHLDFVVDDLDRAADRAIAAGAIREGDCVEWRGSRCIGFADPFGHGFCLIAFAAGGYRADDRGAAAGPRPAS